MTADQWDDLAFELAVELKTFDWAATDALCGRIVAAIRADPAVPRPIVERMLRQLRRKRRFRSVALVADALFETNQASIYAGRQYAQALTDSGYLTASDRFLAWLSGQPEADASAADLHGMRGRIAKQRHVGVPDPGAPRARAYLDEAVRHYLAGFNLDRVKNFWHGINAVALLHRARRKSISLDGVPSAEDLTRTILSNLTSPGKADGEGMVWELATRLEAHIALADYRRAAELAGEYAAALEADAFEIASTLRQLVEVWELSDDEPPGLHVLPILRAALLRREGGSLRFDAREVSAELQGSADLEKVFGPDRFRTIQWYQAGLRCCESIARIETPLGAAYGTGWLFRKGDLFGDESPEPDRLLLMTNAHVVAPKGGELRPENAVAKFELHKVASPFDPAVLYSSPYTEHDVTILALKAVPEGAVPLTLASGALEMDEPPARRRLYIIGHPGGRGLEFSLHDNVVLACNERRVHYRTPTEGGSSGSPVFDDLAWKVVALHHAGKARMARLDDASSFYEANEGIPIAAIRAAIQRDRAQP